MVSRLFCNDGENSWAVGHYEREVTMIAFFSRFCLVVMTKGSPFHGWYPHLFRFWMKFQPGIRLQNGAWIIGRPRQLIQSFICGKVYVLIHTSKAISWQPCNGYGSVKTIWLITKLGAEVSSVGTLICKKNVSFQRRAWSIKVGIDWFV